MPGLLANAQVGVREDLADLIAIVDMRSTPFLSMVPKGPDITNTLFSWQTDAYENPTLAGIIDGQDVTDFQNKGRLRARLYGRVQKQRRSFMVSDFAENISDVAGLGKKQEMANSVKKALKELARDIESVLLSSQDSQVDNGATPGLTRGLGKWISSSAQGDTATAVPAAYLTPSASIDTTTNASSLQESNIQAVLESIWKQVGEKKRYMLFCGSKIKRQFTIFSQYQANVSSNTFVRTFMHTEQDDNRIMSNIDFFAGDFGEVELVPDLWLAQDDNATNGNTIAGDTRGYLVNMDLVQMRYNRRPRYQPLIDQGGGPRGLVDTIYSLAVTNPLGLGKFTPTAY